MNNITQKFANLKNDQIGDGVFIAFEWSDKNICRIYLGTKQCGPMLQYFKPTEPDQRKMYNGHFEKEFENGAWTNLYSRGNFGKKYAYGGNWSGHTKNLIDPEWEHKDKSSELLITGDGASIDLPTGIKGDLQKIEFDCSGSWSIFFETAKTALENRLTIDKIRYSKSLPALTIQHLLKNETNDVISNLMDVVEAYKL